MNFVLLSGVPTGHQKRTIGYFGLQWPAAEHKGSDRSFARTKQWNATIYRALPRA